MSKSDLRMVCIGGAHLDHKIWPQQNKKTCYFGGVARNVAENLHRLNIPVALLGFLGQDESALKVLKHCESIGLSTDYMQIIPEAQTGQYCVHLDDLGAMLDESLQMDLYDLIHWSHIEKQQALLQTADFIFAENNLPADVIQALIRFAQTQGLKLILNAVDVYKARRFPVSLEGVYLLVLNQQEAENYTQLFGVSGQTLAQNIMQRGCENLIVTLGSEGLYFVLEGQSGWLNTQATQVKDTLGAGDALIAAVIFGLIKKQPWQRCLDFGLKASAMTLRSLKPVAEEMSEFFLLQNDQD